MDDAGGLKINLSTEEYMTQEVEKKESDMQKRTTFHQMMKMEEFVQ